MRNEIWIVKGTVGPDTDQPEGTTEWQFSDGPPGERGSSDDYLTLEEGLREHSGSIFHWERYNDAETFKFTVVWGNIGDDPGRRYDHVEAKEPTFDAIMDAAFQMVFNEWSDGGEDGCVSEAMDWDTLRNHTAYDGYAILDGHVPETRDASFT